MDARSGVRLADRKEDSTAQCVGDSRRSAGCPENRRARRILEAMSTRGRWTPRGRDSARLHRSDRHTAVVCIASVEQILHIAEDFDSPATRRSNADLPPRTRQARFGWIRRRGRSDLPLSRSTHRDQFDVNRVVAPPYPTLRNAGRRSPRRTRMSPLASLNGWRGSSS